MTTLNEWIRKAVVPKESLDRFLDPDEPSWAQFDPEVGYILGSFMPRDGVDGCSTISTVQPNGARTARLYTNRPKRINTYGNSFTQCHQVSDGETWQEYLAAHLGEPVGNFGMGGFGVYQAYRRMVRTERGEDGGRVVIFYLWGDDHIRSLMRCRHALTAPWWDDFGGRMFHGNFWSHMEMNLQTGEFVEVEQQLPTPESLYRMSDPDFMVEALHDDLILQLCVAGNVDREGIDIAKLNALADVLGADALDETSDAAFAASAEHLKWAYGFAATRCIIDKVVAFCAASGKEVLFALLCPTATRQLLHDRPRYDLQVAEYLRQRGLRCFDMNEVHLRDYASFKLTPDEYLGRYFIGHYNPAGNHFFAFSIKPMLVDMLDPKPITYRDDAGAVVDFRGYLPDTIG